MDALEEAYLNAEACGAEYWRQFEYATALADVFDLLEEANRLILPQDIFERLEELISLTREHLVSSREARDKAEDEYQIACGIRDSLEAKLV